MLLALGSRLLAAPGPTSYYFENFAGQPGGSGNVDGIGSAARFASPYAIAVDTYANVYVADFGNNLVRKITPSGAVTTLAGSPFTTGTADGTGSMAAFSGPCGVAVDNAGIVYVSDYNNQTIRKVTPAGTVTTLAGLAGTYGSADGTGGYARFFSPRGLAVDRTGNVYVADQGNCCIRKVTPSGMVTTLAGNPTITNQFGYPVGGYADGVGSSARFNNPIGVAVDATGNIYVADLGNLVIRKVSPAGMATTLAGSPGNSGNADGTGATARFAGPAGVALDSAGNLYVTDSCAIRKVSPAGVVATIAGSGNRGSADGAGSAAQFAYPDGIALDPAGNIYVADTVNNTIRRIMQNEYVTTLAGSVASSGNADGLGNAARFARPFGVAVDSGGITYVSDQGNGAIRKITQAGATTTLVGSVGGPAGVAVDADGNVFVADWGGNIIQKITSSGAVTVLAGSWQTGSDNGIGNAARFFAPTGVAVDQAGNVYVTDTGNSTVRKITSTGAVTTLAGFPGNTGSADGSGGAAQFCNPTGLGVDSAGNLYVADGGNSTVRRVTPVGEVTTLAGSAGNPGTADGTGTAARFNTPAGIAVDLQGNVYVTDTATNTVRKVTPAGVVSTIGATPGASGGADGVGTAAQFSWPSGIAVDPAGKLYIADSGNNRISRGIPGQWGPIPLAIGAEPGSIWLTWAAQPGATYDLQYKAGLTELTWQSLFGAMIAVDATPVVSDPLGANMQRFYRVVMLP